jgi:diketogulonate reductase-like aldo/keto reductase
MSVMTAARSTMLPSGEQIPVLGQGTWHMAEDPRRRTDEIAALRLGIELGMTLIDTAEMYADGGAEELVGEAIEGHRDEVFLVSKVLPQNATRHGTVTACDRSLMRLGVDEIDLYLLHWRGAIPLEETLDAFDTLIGEGKIRNWGVSNFDVDDMEELVVLPGGADVATDQVLYNLTRRGIEYDLLPGASVAACRSWLILQSSRVDSCAIRDSSPSRPDTAALRRRRWHWLGSCGRTVSAPSPGRANRRMFARTGLHSTSASRRRT